MGPQDPVDPPQSKGDPQTSLSRFQSLGIGFGAGMLNGLLGTGGGILIVPGLIFLRKLTPRRAVSTSLGSVLLLSVIALAIHLFVSRFYFSIFGTLLLLASGVAGSQGGSWVLKRISQRWLLGLFALLTFFSASNLILQTIGLLPPITEGYQVPPIWSYPSIGLFAGFFSGLLGIGGGGLVVLFYALLFNTPILGGVPLALLVNMTNSLSGVVSQWSTGEILWREVANLVPPALVGIVLGVVLAITLNADLLKGIFALFFIFMGIQLLKKSLTGNKSVKSSAR